MSDGRKRPAFNLALFGFGFVVALATAAVVVFAVMHLVTVPRVSDMAGGRPIFDLRLLGYDRGEAVAFLKALGAEGRAEYMRVQLRLDDVFAPLYGLALSLLLAEILGRAGLGRRLAFVLAFALVVPVAGFDIAENAAIAEMLRRPPDAVDVATVAAASLRTTVKWALAGLASLVAAFALFLANRRIDRKYEQ